MQVPTIRIFAPLALFLTLGTASAQGTEIGFPETFALAEDRAATLAQLVPGSEEHFFYSCLLAQHRGEDAEVVRLLGEWTKRHGRTASVLEMETRQALLSFPRSPEATWRFLEQRLGLRFDHTQQIPGAVPDVPTRLDPALLDPVALAARARSSHPGTMNGFTDRSVAALASTDLPADLLRPLLARLRHPDIANLPALVVRELSQRDAGPFGSLPIHSMLLQSQLDECARLRPALLDEPAFVEQYLTRLRPDADTDVLGDKAAREAWLERLQAFTDRLSAAHNSLKAHVLYHRLQHDLRSGNLDENRFLAYLRLPRRPGGVWPETRVPRGAQLVDPSGRFATGFGPIADDTDLVRACLEHFLRNVESFDRYAAVLQADWVRRVFAETKILAGIGDVQVWAALLDDAEALERIRDRVELRFPPTASEEFRVDEDVVLDVELKHVGRLLIRVFEIDTLSRGLADRDDEDFELESFVAREERSIDVEANPFLRVRRSLPFPSMDHRGVYVVEFIGNGLSARTIVRKGDLQFVERSGPAGHEFHVFDETGALLSDARIQIEGREFSAEEDGRILVPYTSSTRYRRALLIHGDFAVAHRFRHASESYDLHLGVHVERETLLPGQRASLVFRPALRLNGASVPLQALEDAVVHVRALGGNGFESALDLRGLTLDDVDAFVHTIDVPEGLTRVQAWLEGRVLELASGKRIDVRSPTTEFSLNNIEAGPATLGAVLTRNAEGHVLEVRGKDGEPRPDRAVQLILRHRDYTDPIETMLKTDAAGRAVLGALPGIETVEAEVPGAGRVGWDLVGARRTAPRELQGVVGDTLRVALPADAPPLTRVAFGLLESRDGNYVRDAFERMTIQDGVLELRNLEAGDYRLRVPFADSLIWVRVTAGAVRAGWAIGRHRAFLRTAGETLRVSAVEEENDALVVRVRGVTEDTRVHVFTSRYLPPYDAVAHLTRPTDAAAAWFQIAPAASEYLESWEISDEYRYILERREARKFPGNMLARPSLLLNPWDLDATVWNSEIGLGGGAGGRSGSRRGGRAGGGPAASPKGLALSSMPSGEFVNFRFLPTPAPLFTNLRPGADGTLRIPTAALGDRHLVDVVAVDGAATDRRRLVRAEQSFVPKPRRLLRGLDPSVGHVRDRAIEFLSASDEAVIRDARGASVETYDSIPSVFRLFRSLSGSEELDAFTFLTSWPTLEEDAKRALYAEHACHELHVFLHEKDPAFFQAVVRPYLANKFVKDFLDSWLLDEDLTAYLEPWAFGRLNVVEKILLARRIESEAPSIARWVREAAALTPASPANQDALFFRLFDGASLEKSEGMASKLAELQQRLRRNDVGRVVAPEAAGAPAPEPTEGFVVEEAEMLDTPDEDKAADRFIAGGERLRALDARRKQADAPALYRDPDDTHRFAESAYWKIRSAEQGPELVEPNPFWADFAAAEPGEPFVSTSLAHAAQGNFAGMLLALAFLDLPFEAGTHETTVDGDGLRFRAGSDLLLVREEIVDAALPDPAGRPVLVSQNVFRLDEPFTFVDGVQRDAYLSGELVVDTAYGCRVVLTNPTSTPRDLSVLLQVPTGAIPVRDGFVTRSFSRRLAGYETQSLEFAFYFPQPGEAVQLPAQVAEEDRLIATAETAGFRIVATPTTVDTTSWEHVSQIGSTDEVLAFLDTHNLQRVDLDRLLWRLREPTAFEAILGRLRSAHVYRHAVWSYGILHRDVSAAREFLRHEDSLVGQCGRVLTSPLLDVDPVVRRGYEHIEFDPLFHARSHRFGKERTILDAGLAAQYLDLLDVLTYRPALRSEDWLAMTYYLLLQDRVDEALSASARVNADRLGTKLQLDYLRAYLAFFGDDPETARALAAQHADHPVARWRGRFREVLAQLDEAAGTMRADSPFDPDRTRRLTDQASSAPSLAIDVEAGRVRIDYANLERCEVRYYPVDVEFLFSTSPFTDGRNAGGALDLVPNRRDVIELPADANRLEIDLPAEFRNANVIVAAKAGPRTATTSSFEHQIDVRWAEDQGQLQVLDATTGRPLPRAYVKVYAVGTATPHFYKDGYTDLRGRFDYFSVSGVRPTDEERTKLSVLILTEDRGAMVRTIDAPTR
jgi:hypothetical protein